MDSRHPEAAEPENPDWLTPTEALTRFRPRDTGTALAAPAPLATTRFGFRVGSLGFLVAAGTYCEVLGPLRVNPLPNTPPWFGGLLNLRGNLVPVFDLRRLLGEAAADPSKPRLLAIGRGEQAAALWIDGLPEAADAFPQPLKQLPPLPDLVRRHVAGGYWHRAQVWLDVRFDELFRALGRQIAGD